MGCSPRGRTESDTTERLHFVSFTFGLSIHRLMDIWVVSTFGASCFYFLVRCKACTALVRNVSPFCR